MSRTDTIPVPVKSMPHWRVNIRPIDFDTDLIPSLHECKSIIDRNQVRMRGWYYPHISHFPQNSGVGSSWIANWHGTGSMHTEYWRFYQSGQFLHLFCIPEAADADWHIKLLRDTKNHLSHYPNINLDSTPGFMSTVNIIYTITEIIEFIARIASGGLYKGSVFLDLSLNNVNGFVLTTESNRAWHEYYCASESTLRRRKEISIEELISSPISISAEWTTWLYERFGWLNPSAELIRKDIEKYRSGKY